MRPQKWLRTKLGWDWWGRQAARASDLGHSGGGPRGLGQSGKHVPEGVPSDSPVRLPAQPALGPGWPRGPQASPAVAQTSSQPLSLSLSSPAPIWKILPAPPSAFNHVTALLGPFHGGLSLGMRWLTLKAGLKVRTREPSSGLSGMFRGSPLPASRTPLPRLLPVCPCVLPA